VFAGLPKLADKAFVIGFLVPVLLAVFATLIGFGEFPWVVETTRALAAANDFSKLTLSAAAVIVVALVLLLANRPMYRALEGYVGPLSARWLRERALQRWSRLDQDLWDLRAKATAAKDGTPERDAAAVAYRRALRPFLRRYPREEHNVLATRFGNANRAFETYSASVYDVEAILIWPRLSAVIPASFQNVLSDARAQVNCFVNITVLAAAILVARLGCWAAEAGWLFFSCSVLHRHAPPIDLIAVLGGALYALVCGAVVLIAYERAIEHAIALGEQVKVAFDLFLPRLPATLGYVYPGDAAGRSAFWAALEEAFNFHKPIEGLAYAPVAAPEVRGDEPVTTPEDEAEDGAEGEDREGEPTT
jgi:hypothetical protein